MKFTDIITYICIFLLFLVKPSNASAGIIINEILYDPIGSDLGYEWIELYNPTEVLISLSGWSIHIAGTKFQKSVDLNGNIGPNSFFTICEIKVPNCNLNVTSIGMQNGGNATDGVNIQDSEGVIVDTILYDTPNTNQLLNDIGIIADENEVAQKTKSGESLGRKNFIDTDNSKDDFYVFTQPTLGEMNSKNTEDQADVLEEAGDNPLLYIGALLSFIIAKYSVTLAKYHKLFILK